MRRRPRPFLYGKHRALLSDVLPYEVPLTFTNRGFREFLNDNDVVYENNQLRWRCVNRATDFAIKLLFNVGLKTGAGRVEAYNRLFEGELGKPWTVPFSYKITHRENQHRDLGVIHPRNQILASAFYDKYSHLIMYYANLSPFSIRFPHRIAKSIFHRDKLHTISLSNDAQSIEETDKEYETLRSYFVYERYSNINKFYESYQFHHLEERFNYLMKVDISKCFDSIYTHSLAWAIYGKDVTKSRLGAKEGTFAHDFDLLMQRLNYNETNGIVIGPELSRIFAELILQSIDVSVKERLRKTEPPLYNRRDYEICRYVDDYFIFFNNEHDFNRIVQELSVQLKTYNLYLGSEKSTLYDKPIITDLTRAKTRVLQLLDSQLGTLETETPSINDRNKIVFKRSLSLKRIKAKQLITQFKIIVRECDVDYKELLNYSLAIIDRKNIETLRAYNETTNDQISMQSLSNYLLGILEFTFFIYSVSPRVNSTITLCRILVAILSFFRNKRRSADAKHLISKLIHDKICLILQKNKGSEYTQVETLYLLIVLSALGKDYWLDAGTLCSYFDINSDVSGCSMTRKLHYFTITVLLFYMKDKKRYNNIRTCLENHIVSSLDAAGETRYYHAEHVLLLFDTLSCPYISESVKRQVLSMYGVEGKKLQAEIMSLREHWFTKWVGLDYERELDFKKGYEVY